MAYSSAVSKEVASAKIKDFIARTPVDKLNQRSPKEYEDIWNSITHKYKRIILVGIEFVSIGETLLRIGAFIRDKELRSSDDFWLVLPTFFEYYDGAIYNEAIFELFKADVNFVTYNNLDFWNYAFENYSNNFSLDYFNKYLVKAAKVYWLGDNSEKYVINETISDFGKDYINKMNLTEPFVCIHARESKTKNNFIGYISTSNADFELDSLNAACTYLHEQGITGVRMGKFEDTPCNLPNCIDYANNFYNSMMDFYLIANCKFMIGCASGISTITPYFGRPVLLTNVTVLHLGYEETVNSKYDLFMPKKFYSREKGRYLNYYESLEISNACERNDAKFERMGIDIIDNTETELLKAVKEMNMKIDGKWKVTEKELALQNKIDNMRLKFKQSHEFVKNSALGYRLTGNPNYLDYSMVPLKISYTYIISNQYLVEEYDD